jgi:tetratricopeptide (TPR) repeat protein
MGWTGTLARHRHQILIALGVLAGAAVLGGLVFFRLRALRYALQNQLSQAQAMAFSGKTQEALDALTKVVGDSRSSPQGLQANLLRGDLLSSAGKFPDALAAYREVYDQTKSPAYRSLALAGIAYAQEENQNLPEAAARQEQFIKDYPTHYLAGRAYESLARLQMAQSRWNDAQATLEKLITLFPATPWAQTAKERTLPLVKSRAAAGAAPAVGASPK